MILYITLSLRFSKITLFGGYFCQILEVAPRAYKTVKLSLTYIMFRLIKNNSLRNAVQAKPAYTIIQYGNATALECRADQVRCSLSNV